MRTTPPNKDSPGKLYNIAAYNLVMVPLSGFVVLDDISMIMLELSCTAPGEWGELVYYKDL